jgi:AcrR family transcriptional regulator
MCAAEGRAEGARRTRLSAEREGELFGAVRDLLREVGYDALTMDAVAARSRCSKATLYRQWQGKPRLVAAALRHQRPPLEQLDTGSLRGDLHELARRMGEAKKDVALMQAVAPAAHKNKDLAEALHEALIQPELDVLQAILGRAVARGEAEAGTPAHEFLPHMVTGALIARPLIERCEADATYVERYLDAVVLPVLVRNRQQN